MPSGSTSTNSKRDCSAMASKCVNTHFMQREAKKISRQYATATPFPHVVIDNALTISAEAARNFPSEDWTHWNQLGDQYQCKKFSCSNISVIPEPFRQIIRELSEPAMLGFLERITGVKKLIPDPYLTGGGLHLSGPGGILAAHTDFHVYRKLELYRRVNLIIYLNDGWRPEYGGCLSLFEKNTEFKSVVPVFGRMIIFTTDDKSIHGFPSPVAEGKWRKSIAMYYYTSSETATFSGDETTYWRQHDNPRGFVGRIRFSIYKGLLLVSRGFSAFAHLANPNQGMGLIRTILRNRKKE